MPRPLKILKGIIEQDQQETRYKIGTLLGETVATAERATRLLTVCLRTLLDIDRASIADQSIVNLVVRFCNDIKASRILLGEGFILNSMMMIRDAVEILVLAEYLHEYPNEAQAWQDATSFKERRRFGINEIKDKVKNGSDWKDIFDWLSSYIHPNDNAKAAYSRNRPIFGHNLYIGSFYDPGQTAILLSMQIAICVNFIDSFISWYENTLPAIANQRKELEKLEKEYRSQNQKLKEHGDLAQQKIDKEIEITRLSKDEIISLLQFLDSLD